MIKITCKLTGHELSLVNAPVVSSDSVGFDAVKFQFDTNWTGFHKVAVFWGSDTDTAYGSLVDDNDEAVIPTVILEEKATIRFGVFGEDPDGLLPRITSTILKYKIKEGAWSESFYGDDEVTQSLVDQLRVLAFAISEETHQFVEDSTEAYETFTENSTEAYEAFTQECTDIVEAAKDYVLDAMETKVEEDMPGIITGWLDDHVNPESDVVIDDTLSISGAAADAAACGDLKSAISEETRNIFIEETELGAIGTSTGKEQSSATQIRNTDFIPVDVSTVYYFAVGKTGAQVIIYWYTSADENTYIDRTSWKHEGTFTIPSNGHYIRVAFDQNYGTTYLHDMMICKNSETDKNYIPHISAKDFIARNANEKTRESMHISNTRNICDDNFELGTINTSTGVNSSSSTQIRTADYIPIEAEKTYQVIFSTSGAVIVYFYNSSKEFISRGSWSNSGVNIKSPENSAYLRLAFDSTYGATYNNDVCICLSTDNDTYIPIKSIMDYTSRDMASLIGKSVERSTLTIATFNVGKFNYGNSPGGYPAADLDQRVADWFTFLGKYDLDMLCTNEFNETLDASGNVNAVSKIFGKEFLTVQYPTGYAEERILSKVKTSGILHTWTDLYGGAQRTFVFAGQKRIPVFCLHLSLENPADRRARDIERIINFMKEWEYAIVCGDFNVASGDEYNAFKTAGLNVANCGDFGSISTHNNSVLPLDNIITTSNIKISWAEAYTDAHLSDHYPLIARLLIK